MSIFADITTMGHEQVVFCHNEEAGLRAIIAIHDTTLGPSLGGCRFYPYGSDEEAIRDVLRLSRGMTYKAAVAGLDLGGGKAVIIGDPAEKTEALFRAFGRHVDSLGGRYITAEDMNTTVDDMNFIRQETQYVTGVGEDLGGSGNPAPVTAWGVFQGVRASLDVVYGSPSVEGRSVAIQGMGNVGYRLAEFLHERGAHLFFNDVDNGRLRKAVDALGGEVLDDEALFSAEVDVLAPCAIGGVVNAQTIPKIRAPIIAGGANNILEDEDRDSQALMERNIMYAPDYVINSGGLISVYAELNGWTREKAMEDTTGIFDTISKILKKAKAESVTTLTASNRIAEERISAVGKLKST